MTTKKGPPADPGAAHRRSRRSRVQVIDALLADDPFRDTRTETEVAEMERRHLRDLEHPYTRLLSTLVGTGAQVPEGEARRIWRRIVVHRRTLAEAVGRLVPLRAAAIDWLALQDSDRRPFSAVILSRSLLQEEVEEGRMDPLTGLPSRRYLLVLLERHLALRPALQTVLAYVDLDGFKQVNDLHGHERGDAVLRSFARCALTELRDTDVVGRLGGDEFALLLPGTALPPARRLLRRIRERFELRQPELNVSFSFGLVALPESAEPGAALRTADRAMYRQKRRRRALPPSARAVRAPTLRRATDPQDRSPPG
jgi:diguanylate cyclase (GGDEF)-like protein